MADIKLPNASLFQIAGGIRLYSPSNPRISVDAIASSSLTIEAGKSINFQTVSTGGDVELDASSGGAVTLETSSSLAGSTSFDATEVKLDLVGMNCGNKKFPWHTGVNEIQDTDDFKLCTCASGSLFVVPSSTLCENWAAAWGTLDPCLRTC